MEIGKFTSYTQVIQNRFYHLMWELSNLVLKKKFQREFPNHYDQMEICLSNFRNKNFSQPRDAKFAQNVMMLHIRNQVRKLIENADKISQLQQEYQNFADKVTNEYRDTILKQGEINESIERFGFYKNMFTEESSRQRKEKIRKNRNLWTHITRDFQIHEQTRGFILHFFNLIKYRICE